MSTPLPPEDERLMTRINKHPQLRGRVERLVDIVEDVGDELRKAAEAERRVIEEVRRLGQEVLEGCRESHGGAPEPADNSSVPPR